MRRIAPIALALALLTGCGGDGRAEAVDVARSWLEAVRDGEHERACGLMADSAVGGLKVKVGLGKDATCVGAVRAYVGTFPRREIDRVLDVGLEAEGPVKKDQIGVFPRTGARELEVILMRRSGDEWKVASTALGFSR